MIQWHKALKRFLEGSDSMDVIEGTVVVVPEVKVNPYKETIDKLFEPKEVAVLPGADDEGKDVEVTDEGLWYDIDWTHEAIAQCTDDETGHFFEVEDELEKMQSNNCDIGEFVSEMEAELQSTHEALRSFAEGETERGPSLIDDSVDTLPLIILKYNTKIKEICDDTERICRNIIGRIQELQTQKEGLKNNGTNDEVRQGDNQSGENGCHDPSGA
jgi:hypothetical protein